MKTFYKILVGLLISVAVFTSMERGSFSFFNTFSYIVENTSSEAPSDNSISQDSDSSEADVTLSQRVYSFNLKDLSSRKVIVSDAVFLQNIDSCVWQPPKIS